MPLGLGGGMNMGLPEEQRAAQVEDAARGGYSAGIGLTEAPAAAPPQAQPQAAPQAPQAAPADPMAAPAGGAQQPQPITKAEPLIDFKKNPFGAIGLVLSSVAAGMEGRESPVGQLQDARAKQDASAKKAELDAQAAQFQRAEVGTRMFEGAYKYGLQNPDNVDDFLGQFKNVPGMEGIGVAVKNALTAKVDQMDQRLSVIRQTQSPLMAEIASSLLESNDIEGFENFTTALLKAKQRVEEAADTTTATTGARIAAEDAGGRGPKTPDQLGEEAEAVAAGTARGKAKVEGPDDSKSVAQENVLRKEFVNASGTFVQTRDAFQKVRSAVKRNSAAGDISLIFAYMKMLDPGSTVREGEAATVEQARGVPAGVLNLYNRLTTGQRLTDGQRSDFSGSAKALFDDASKNQKKLVGQYETQAAGSGARKKNVIVDYFEDEQDTGGATDYDKDGNPRK